MSPYAPLLSMGAYRPSQISASVSEYMDFQVQNSDLASLRMGGARNNCCVDAIVYRTGQTFSASKRNWMKMTFHQNVKR
jgi:hypothetical protein